MKDSGSSEVLHALAYTKLSGIGSSDTVQVEDEVRGGSASLRQMLEA